MRTARHVVCMEELRASAPRPRVRACDLQCTARGLLDAFDQVDPIPSLSASARKSLKRQFQIDESNSLLQTLFADPMQFKHALQRRDELAFLNQQGAMSPEPQDPQGTAIPVESQFEQLLKKLKESMLATLKEENRVDVPVKKRPEMNYMVLREVLYQTAMPSAREDASHPDVVLTIAFYQRNKPHLRAQEFQILASSAVVTCMDLVDCASGEIDISLGRNVPEPAFMVIGEHALVDDRIPVDYLKAVEDYNGDPGRPQQRRVKHILSARSNLSRVPCRLGVRYSYTHQGSCEHSFVILDMNYVAGLTPAQLSMYPRQVFRCKILRQKCRICLQFPAQYVTVDDINAGENPAFFCRACYRDFHFDAMERPLSTYKVFPYTRADTQSHGNPPPPATS